METPGPEQPASPAGGPIETSKEEARRLTSTTVEQGKQTASTATDAAGQVAASATDGARQVASEAAQQATEVGKQASFQVRDLAQQAQDQLREQALSQTARAAGALKDLGDQVRTLAQNQQEDVGVAADAARQLGDKITEVASHLEERGFDGTVEDLRHFARRRPGLFLLGAAASGFAVSRLGRGLQSEQQPSSAPTSSTSSSSAPASSTPTSWAPRDDAATAPAVPVPTLGGEPAIGAG